MEVPEGKLEMRGVLLGQIRMRDTTFGVLQQNAKVKSGEENVSGEGRRT